MGEEKELKCGNLSRHDLCLTPFHRGNSSRYTLITHRDGKCFCAMSPVRIDDFYTWLSVSRIVFHGFIYVQVFSTMLISNTLFLNSCSGT